MVVAVSKAPAGRADSGDQALPKVLLRVSDLKVTLPTLSLNYVEALDGVSFQVASGEAVGLMGESGAGKTTLARSLLRLLPASSRVEGSIEFEGLPLLSLAAKALRSIRGDRISLIHQDSSVLNPVRRVGEQLVDVLGAHRPWNRKRCREEALSILQQMSFEDADRVYSAYPHQLSGGEQQRIVVAQGLICRPALVVADEPTASVDRDTAAQILNVFRHRKKSFGTSIILISHDVHVLAEVADTLIVMHAGRIVESGPTEQVLKEPKHPYTRALLKCADLAEFDRRQRTAKLRLPTIAGMVPALADSREVCGLENDRQQRDLYYQREYPSSRRAG